MTKPKAKYEPPSITDLGGNVLIPLAQRCRAGGTPIGQCRPGGQAVASRCRPGSTAALDCRAGGTAGRCRPGGDAWI